MLKELILDNFKVHRHLELALKNLNVFTGYNSAGKSSVIQSLLLLRQSCSNSFQFDNIDLNGNLCNLGFCKDVLCYKAQEDIVSIHLYGEEEEGLWQFDMNDRVANKTFTSFCGDLKLINTKQMNLFNTGFQYISINRWGPVESYPLDSKVVEQDRQLSKDKGNCELTPHFLYYYGKEKTIEVPDEMCCEKQLSHDLLTQISAWEGLISDGVRVHTRLIEKSYTLEYSYSDGNDETPNFSAINVGSGLTFVLPIITALLSTPKGGLVIIENPEAHLHPKGQAELAKLICAAAQYGVQIIIETHSDHIINGILLESKRYEASRGEYGIDRRNVSIVQFDKDSNTQLSSKEEIILDSDGRIKNQPRGFFDQIEDDMLKLLNID